MYQTKLTDEAGRLASLRRYELLDTPPEANFDKITQLVKTVLNVPIAAVSLIDADRQWFKSCIGLEVRETARDISFCTHTIKARHPLVVSDAAQDPKFAQNPLVLGPPFIASYAGAPLISPEGYVLGSLCAIDTVPRQFDDWQIDVLKSFAALVVDEFELRRLSHTDRLTGAHSRRALLAEAERSISQFSRNSVPSSIVSFDIDHFTQYNETYGHAAGDEVLRAVAALLMEAIRPGDILARLGGDEFALLLSLTDIDQAAQATERCRAAIAGMTFPHDPQLRVTASFGIAALAPGCLTADHWLANADTALTEARRTGGNQSCVHVEAPPEDDEDCILLRLSESAEIEDELEAEADDELEDDIELHKYSIEPLTRGLWRRLRRARSVRAAKTGRLAYGGMQPGMVNCQILHLREGGVRVETSAKLSPMPEFFSVEFSGIYCRATIGATEGYEIDLEFIFDGDD